MKKRICLIYPIVFLMVACQVISSQEEGTSDNANRNSFEKKSTMQACESAKEAIKNLDFSTWQGLPENCSLDFFHQIDTVEGEFPSRGLGENFTPTKFMLLDYAGYYRPTISFIDKKVVLFDAMNPKLKSDWANLKEQLGEPAEIIDAYYGTLLIPKGEWIYPNKGISLFVNPENQKYLHIMLFNACALGNYKQNLRPHLQKKRRPSVKNKY